MTKTVLITGASTGIGEACALHLDAKGHRVFAGVRKEEDAESLRRKASDRLTPLFLDVTDEAQIETAAKTIEADVGSLAGLVNNAGVARGGPLEYLPIDEWRDQIEVNVIGQVAITKAVLSLLRKDRGRVVFIGSIGGRVATPLMGPYNASKFAIEGIGEALRMELHPWGMHVAVVEPGAIRTAIWDKGRETADRLDRELPAEAHERYAEHIAAIRKGIEMQDRNAIGPEAVAKAVEHALFARRPRSRYVVGKDAYAMAAMTRAVPTRAREAIIRRFAGP
ncbi:MAG: SDR family oxidoreductase [Actinobacteria bacterium]|nr:SDR family oxidoreductase [Actinomycetota bacterium]